MSTEFGMPHEQKLLNRICAKCGEDYGKHKARRNLCPIMEGRRIIDFYAKATFEEWKEDPK